MSTRWELSNAEPSLDDLLRDPIVRLLMQGDRTGEGEVRRLIERARTSLVAPGSAAPTAAAPTRKTKRSGKPHAA